MKHRDIWERGLQFLAETTQQLSTQNFESISNWPEYPLVPDVDLRVPDELATVHYTVMKDTQPDGSIRVAIQMYRHRFLGIGTMHADGFFISKENVIRYFSEKDTWAVT